MDHGGRTIKSEVEEFDWRSFFIQTGKTGSDVYKRSMNQALEALASTFDNFKTPYSGVTQESLEQTISKFQLGTQTGQPLEEVLDQVMDRIVKNSIIVQHPNCIAHLHCPPLIPALAAELIISSLNQSMDSWDQAAAATYTEIKMVEWLTQLFHFDSLSGGVFTSGGTQSNLMGLLLARDAFIETQSGHNVQEQGLPSYADKLRIICSDTSHFSISKSASILGLGNKSIAPVETTSAGAMHLPALKSTMEQLKSEGLIPFAIVATAGTTDHGAIDPIKEIASIAQRNGLWLHVDAAYGGGLMLTDHKGKLEGIESADSITVDFHKMFYQPISCGAFLLKEESQFRFLKYHADYLNRETDQVPNLVTISLATTRRFDALKLLISLQTLGTAAFAQMLQHVIDLAGRAATILKKYPQFELLSKPQISTILFRYIKTDEKEQNDLNRRIRNSLLEMGEAVIGETTINDKVYLKLTILNPCLNEKQIDALFRRIDSQAESIK